MGVPVGTRLLRAHETVSACAVNETGQPKDRGGGIHAPHTFWQHCNERRPPPPSSEDPCLPVWNRVRGIWIISRRRPSPGAPCWRRAQQRK